MPKEIFGPKYPFLKKEEWLRFSELDLLLEEFIKLGVEKVRLTGGEPLLRPGLSKYINSLTRYPEIKDIALTTNGLLLSNQAQELKDAGLHRITVSLDAMNDKLVGEINGKGLGTKRILEGIKKAQQVGLGVKINTVVEKGVNEQEILPLLEYFEPLGIPVRFIEFMDVGNHNQWKLDRVFSAEEILLMVQSRYPVYPTDTSSTLQVARKYQYGEKGEMGIITSVTQPFCQNCTRARISANGQLYTCLFAQKGVNLKQFLRSPNFSREGLLELLISCWQQRKDRYSEERATQSNQKKKVEMSYIGG